MKKNRSGFTVVEIVIIISVIAILAGIGVVSFFKIQQKARDYQRSTKSIAITEAIEKYYDKHGEYPTCDTLKNGGTTITADSLKQILGIKDSEILVAPKAAATDDSFFCTNSDDDDNPSAVNDVFTYAYLSENSWKFKYYNEVTDTISIITNRRNVVSVNTDPGKATIAITVSPSEAGSASANKETYKIANSETATLTATNKTGFSFKDWSGDCSGTSPAAILIVDKNKNCTANFTINKPAAPTVTHINTSPYWSWASTCPTGTVTTYPNYGFVKQIIGGANVYSNMNITPTDDKAAHTSADTYSTTGSGYLYTFYVQELCTSSSDTNIKSEPSNYGYESYENPAVGYALTVTARTGGSNPTGGATGLTAGSSRNISVTENTGYKFNGWTQSTNIGVSGGSCPSSQSGTAIMPSNGNMECIANFTIRKYHLALKESLNEAAATLLSDNDYNYSSLITLTPRDISGYSFSRWEPSDCNSFTITADRTCTAYYSSTTPSTENLRIRLLIDGVTESTVYYNSFDYGASVDPANLYAIPSNYRFQSWNPTTCGEPFKIYSDTTCILKVTTDTTPTPTDPTLQAPSAPSVYYILDTSTSNVKAAYRWSTTCASGTPVYYYRAYDNDDTDGIGYDSTWYDANGNLNSTAAVGSDYISVFQGVTLTMQVKAKCTSGGLYSSESGTTSSSYLRDVDEPKPPSFTFNRKHLYLNGIEDEDHIATNTNGQRYLNNVVRFEVTSNCGAYTSTMIRYDEYIGNSAYTFASKPSATTPGWYSGASTNNSSWMQNSYVQGGWLYNVFDLMPYKASYPEIPAGYKFGIAVDYYCKNPRTGVKSVSSTDRQSSGTMLVPTGQENF